ncbi:MAG: nucleotidyltransferase family protein [Oscillospiraceae bacterium]|nr:nucleotidyltransferase family protein [Oscillospiraceae bacterium]
MASGMARRFGSNKLLHDFLGEPVMNRILRTMAAAPLAAKVVVTRHPEIKKLCDEENIPVVLHDMPLQSDTVALGVNALLEMCPDMTGCMFAASDQPCLSIDSVTALCEAFQAQPGQIWRMSWQGTVGNPVVFPAFTFHELLHLPPDKGGGAVIKKHPELVRTVEVKSEHELVDVDTPEILAELLKSL